MVKVEMQTMEDKGIVAFAFEASNEADIPVIDALVEAVMGDYKKQGGFVNNKRFVVHVHDPLLKQSPAVVKVKEVKKT